MDSQQRRTEQRQEQRQARRERILEVSRDIVQREGFAALSMRKLADAIDYSPAALYLHFRNRADIARALREEGHVRLREAFLPHATIADAAARLKAMARAYVEFGLAEPQTYRLMFMEASGSDADDSAVITGSNGSGDAGSEPGAATLSLIADAFVELRAADRLPAHAPPAACAQALWANLHGIVALELSGARLLTTPAATLAELSLDAWFAADDRRTATHNGEPTQRTDPNTSIR